MVVKDTIMSNKKIESNTPPNIPKKLNALLVKASLGQTFARNSLDELAEFVEGKNKKSILSILHCFYHYQVLVYIGNAFFSDQVRSKGDYKPIHSLCTRSDLAKDILERAKALDKVKFEESVNLVIKAALGPNCKVYLTKTLIKNKVQNEWKDAGILHCFVNDPVMTGPPKTLMPVHFDQSVFAHDLSATIVRN